VPKVSCPDVDIRSAGCYQKPCSSAKDSSDRFSRAVHFHHNRRCVNNPLQGESATHHPTPPTITSTHLRYDAAPWNAATIHLLQAARMSMSTKNHFESVSLHMGCTVITIKESHILRTEKLLCRRRPARLRSTPCSRAILQAPISGSQPCALRQILCSVADGPHVDLHRVLLAAG